MSYKKRLEGRKKRHLRIRQSIVGSKSRPRLNIFRSSKHIYAQLIDDALGVTLAGASSLLSNPTESSRTKTEVAKEVGRLIAGKAMEKGIKEVVFDRGGYLYHGRIKALAEGAREAGLEF